MTSMDNDYPKDRPFGFKMLTVENWTKPDPIMESFVKLLPNGETQPLDGDDYLRSILEPKLQESVPREVRALFEVTRGGMAYGFYFYPLYALASEQLMQTSADAGANRYGGLQVSEAD